MYDTYTARVMAMMFVSGLDAGGYCGPQEETSRTQHGNVVSPNLFWRILTKLGILFYICPVCVKFNRVSRV